MSSFDGEIKFWWLIIYEEWEGVPSFFFCNQVSCRSHMNRSENKCKCGDYVQGGYIQIGRNEESMLV